MERCNMFKCAMAFLWSLFIAFFILLCLTSCEHEKTIKLNRRSVKCYIFGPVVSETRVSADATR